MPAYNFKKQFVSQILSGKKRTTIRQRRKRPTVVGDRLFLYTGMRQPGCHLVKDTECTKVTPIKILTNGTGMMIFLPDGLLDAAEVDALVKTDGFSDWQSFRQFFFDNYPPDFAGELIEWAP